MNENQLIIHNSEQLRSLLTANMDKTTIVLQIDGLGDSEAWGARLNKHYGDCGCMIGAVSVLIAVGVYMAYLVFITWGLHAEIEQEHVWIGVAIFVLSTVLGKLIGLFYARLKLKGSIRDLIKSLDGY